MAEPVLIAIRVHPGASRPRVGGLHAEPGRRHAAGPGQKAPSQTDVLGVWVSQRAVDGKATEAALAALAAALGVSRRSVRLARGERTRVKLVEVSDPPSDLAARLARWAG